MMTGKILIVDDEEAVRFFAADGLLQAGWEVHEAGSGEAALALLASTPCDVILLDLRMGGLDGLEVMRQVKERWPEIMIIIITAYASLDSAIEAVRQGAFDYLRKPFKVSDVIACADRALNEKNELDRQRRAARQAEAETATIAAQRPVPAIIVQSGALVIDLSTHTVSLAGQSISLTPTEYELLRILARSPGQPVSLEQLVQQGLGYDSSDPQALETLRVHISHLRRKVGAGHIVTIRGGGYTLAYAPPPA